MPGIDTSAFTTEHVMAFWENNPLWTGESAHELGSKEFFEEHRATVIEDCFAGQMDERIFPKSINGFDRILDLGCGPGFWLVEYARRGAREIVGADLTTQALNLSRQRCEHYGVNAELRQENAEKLSFLDGSFSHVNCQGVIHHTPNTELAVAEIARVLKPGGTASLSVYHQNVLLKAWPAIGWTGHLIHRMGGGLRGRGRESIFLEKDPNEVVRLYDGADNPIGKAYSTAAFRSMLEEHFHVEEIFFHFFPARALPFSIPKWLHRRMDSLFGFMIYASVTKR